MKCCVQRGLVWATLMLCDTCWADKGDRVPPRGERGLWVLHSSQGVL